MIVHPDFPRHRKTLKLAAQLGVSVGDAALMLLNMWGHCQSGQSDFIGRDAYDVAACCYNLSLPADRLLDAMLSIGWVHRSEEGFHASGWADHNASWLAMVRGGRNSAKARKIEKENLSLTSTGTCQPLEQPLAEPPAKQLANLAGAEKKRREEISNTDVASLPLDFESQQPDRQLSLQELEQLTTKAEHHENAGLVEPKAPEEKPNKARGTLEEFKAYAVKLGMPGSEGASAFDHYTSKGWKIGKNPMCDWQAALRNWHRRWEASNPTAPRKFTPTKDVTL